MKKYKIKDTVKEDDFVKLLEELKERAGIVWFEPVKLKDKLWNATAIPVSPANESNFEINVITDEPYRLNLLKGYHNLDLKKIFKNKEAENNVLSKSGRIKKDNLRKLGLSSYDKLSTSLRSEDTLMSRLYECGQPYSFLFQQTSYDFDNPKERLYVIKKPFLLIPGMGDANEITEWETNNTIIGRERAFGYIQKLKTEKYLNQ